MSVASAIIFLYGGNLKSLLTGGTLGALLTTPIALYVRYELCIPNQLPEVIGAVTGMWLGGIIALEVCKVLPWMKLEDVAQPSTEPVSDKITLSEYKLTNPNRFFIRRLLADYTEPMFVGNEIAGLFLIIGTLITWFFNPMHPAYGSGLLPNIILSQIISGSFAIYIYWEGWRDNDWYPTFVPIVSIAPACVLFYGGTMPVIFISAILGALFGPPIANLINRNIPEHWHIFIGLTFSMALCTLIITIILKYIGMILPIF